MVVQKKAAKRLVVTYVSALKSRDIVPPCLARLVEFTGLPVKRLAVVLPQDQIRPQPGMSPVSVCEGVGLYHSMVEAQGGLLEVECLLFDPVLAVIDELSNLLGNGDRAYLANGSGRTWNLMSLLRVPFPPSTCQSA